MSVDIKALEDRYNKIAAEISYSQRKSEEEAAKAVSYLASISEEDIEALAEFVPELRNIAKYTVEDLLSNEHQEVLTLNTVYSKVTDLLDTWLARLEGQIW